MRTAIDAYKSVAKEIANPRDLEANLLLKAAARLQAVSDSWERDRSDLNEALTYNRKLWTFFLEAVTSPGNQLPAEIRQNIANLGVFIMNRTMSVTSKPERAALAALININRELAAGLRGATV
jgi:flagellar biosynthesis activator protein FlaF